MGLLFGLLGEIQKLNDILSKLYLLLKEILIHMTAIDDALTQLKADVAALTTVEQSAVALLNGLTAQIQQLINAGGDPAKTLADIQQVVSGVEADTAELAAAVTANTPAAP